MKKIGFIIFMVALVIGISLANLLSWGKASVGFFKFSVGSRVAGSGNSATERRDLAGFNSIDVGGAFIVEAVAQKDFSVEVQADDNLLPLIRTEVRGETLYISSEKRFSTSSPMIIRIAAPDIENLEISGASKVSVDNIKNEALRLDLSGASKVTVKGETKNLVAELSGACKLEAEELQAENATVDASGASYAGVSVLNDLKTDLSGASRVSYSGNPKNIEKKVSGASSVTGR